MKTKNAVFTLVQNDMIGLKLWLSYYTRYFDDVYVFGFNCKDTTRDNLRGLQSLFSFNWEVLEQFGNDKVDGDPLVMLGFLKAKQEELLKSHKWVLFCNVDEILVTSTRYRHLKDLMDTTDKLVVPCVAYEVIQVAGEKPIDYKKPYFMQRSYWIKNPNYNKIILSRIALKWNAGAHQVEEVQEDESKHFFNTGLYLIHLKHVDLQRKGDFGPYFSIVKEDANITEHWRDRKEKIPQHIRKLL